jgi:type IV secretory pathway TrbD component
MNAGWSAPIYPVLTETPTMGGLPRTFAVLFGASTYALVMILQSWLCLPLLVVLYRFSRFWARRDPEFLVVFFRHLQQKEYYHA